MILKQLRQDKGLTQINYAVYLGIPLRTYKRYEQDESKINIIKYDYIINILNEYNTIDEEHGILTIEEIKTICYDLFKLYEIQYCYFFGFYTKATANKKSDIDLLISMPLNGLKNSELYKLLRENLHKKSID